MKSIRVLVGVMGLSLLGLALACHKEEAAPGAVPTDAAAGQVAPTEGLAPQEPQPKATRRFLAVEGAVTVDGAPAAVGNAIGETSTIETAADGSAVITLEPGSVVKLRPSTKVTLGTSERKKLSVKLALGAIWSFLTPGSSYEVVSPNAVAGVRGTVFYMEAEAAGATYVCACEGKVEMQTPDGKGFKKVVNSPKKNHKGFRFAQKGKKIKAKPAKRANHTDDEAATIMAHVEESK
ncbi:MAG: FecR family protein [Myxococcota bacterium]